jgi:hypothetical protein
MSDYATNSDETQHARNEQFTSFFHQQIKRSIFMKSFCYFILFAFVVGAFLVPTQQAQAQSKIVGDTMYVDWQNPTTHLPITNALRNAVLGDTVAGGARKNANRVYLLLINGLYWEADRIENAKFNLTIVGQQYNMNDANNYPAQLQLMDLRDDGTSADSRLITGQNNVTLKNIYITGRTNSQGVQTAYQPIQIDASNCRFLVDNCIIEQSNFALIAYTATGNEITYTNNKFRNLIGYPSTQQWEGRGISIWADQDSVIVENNTFFNLEFTPFQLEGGSAKYVRINHNTFVNVGRGINTGSWWQNAYITNNLLINCWWHGEGWSDMHGSGRDPRQVYNGLYTIGQLPSVYGPNEGRRIVIGKQYAYLDPKFTTFYKDTIQRAYFVDPVTRLDFLNVYTDHMNVGKTGKTDTVWLSSLPAGLATYPLTDATWQQPKFSVTGATMADSMWRNITLLRAGITPGTPYFYKPVKNASDEAWPLPEKFSYTDATLMTAGTDGLPIGDLNWFPTQLANFNSNKTKNVSAIEALAGSVVSFSVDSTTEAESGTVGGTATVTKFTGFSYFYMQSGGYIQWDFNLTTGGVYGVNIWSMLEGNSQRGQHFFINGNEVHDNYGWGEMEFTSKQLTGGHGPGINLDDATWNWYFYPKDSILASDQANFIFKAGANTVKITPSWGYQDFAGIDLIPVGTTPTYGQTIASPVIALRAPDATSSIVTPKGQGAPWIPSLFKSVAMGTGGTVTWSMKPKVSANYRLRIFYQNPGASQTFQIKEGSTVLASPVLAGKADSTGLDVMSASFALTAGTHSITLSGAGANVDYVQLIKESVASGVAQQGDIPLVYTLEQNYPNPFNPTTTIKFSLPKTSNATLTVYNILGQKVATLFDGRMNAGVQAVRFDATMLSSGVYIYRLEAGDFRSQKKMMLLK